MPWEYSANYEMAYQTMDRIHHGPKSEDQLHGSLVEIKADSIRLNEMQELFELFVVEYRQVDQCLKEARLLKAVWDMISHVTIQVTTKIDSARASFCCDWERQERLPCNAL
jgi:hypothetical protein